MSVFIIVTTVFAVVFFSQCLPHKGKNRRIFSINVFFLFVGYVVLVLENFDIRTPGPFPPIISFIEKVFLK